MAFHTGDETFIGRTGAVRDVQRIADGMAQDDDDVMGIVGRQFKGPANGEIRENLTHSLTSSSGRHTSRCGTVHRPK